MLSGETADAKGRAEVVEHHGGLGCSPGDGEELTVLMVVVPRVVSEMAFAEPAHAGLECGVVGEARR